MPVNQTLRWGIDTLRRSLSRQDFQRELETLLRRLFEVLRTTPVDAPDSAAYISYHLSTEFMRSTNWPEQASIAGELTSLLSRLYNEPALIAILQAAPREHSLAMVVRLYNIHHTMIMSGLRADNGPALLDANDALRLLRIAVRAWAPWRASVQLTGSITSYHRVRLHDPGGGVQVQIGWQRPVGARVDLRVVTLNMQGVAADSTDKFRTIVLPMVRQHHVVVLQEAGVWPTSARPIADHRIADQFGALHDVHERVWEAGTSSRSEPFRMYYLEVGRLRVRLGMVLAENVTVLGITVIADGVATPSGGYAPRPILGLRIRIPGLREAITVYTFHAISNGGSNSPRMLRETVWHSDTPFVMLGDFNRDPREPGPSHPNSSNWISPPGIADLVPANAPTHPSSGPVNMLDYAFAYGLAALPAAGRVMLPVDSDHRPVSYTFVFSG
ncbi:endonuclease/exonuclease/phosphatase family protein [Pseudomonas entomophila]|uniref:endonuclease/exonuclease/phosphatase family protein n=1 Tax=Pseudomonas entomophila TaxID=312306 RepID=UPI001BCD06C3|nr:endonuclease/exonuclease/phosphatase family protein [Pseudomonas entomophila]QVM89500.1 endonuclease/exonuclease/phosphatase family protein [Pseudomonas entomophila]